MNFFVKRFKKYQAPNSYMSKWDFLSEISVPRNAGFVWGALYDHPVASETCRRDVRFRYFFVKGIKKKFNMFEKYVSFSCCKKEK